MDDWSVDFDFENRYETIREQRIGELEEQWTVFVYSRMNGRLPHQK